MNVKRLQTLVGIQMSQTNLENYSPIVNFSSPSCKECSRFILKRSSRFQSNNSESA